MSVKVTAAHEPTPQGIQWCASVRAKTLLGGASFRCATCDERPGMFESWFDLARFALFLVLVFVALAAGLWFLVVLVESVGRWKGAWM